MKILLALLSVFLIFGCIDRIDTIFCSRYAQIAIEKNGLSPVHSCTDTTYPSSNGTDVHYVEISYGQGEDCPSGCVYDTYSAVVTEEGQLYPTNRIEPTDVERYLSISCVDQNNLSCYYDPIYQYDGRDEKFLFEEGYNTSALLDEQGVYWQFDFSDVNGFSGDCRKSCRVDGRLQLRRDNESMIKVEYNNVTTKIGDFVDCEFNVNKDNCLLYLAMARNNISICQEMSVGWNNCYDRVAIVNQEPKYCEEVVSSQQINEKSECFIDLIKRTRNTSICDDFDTGITMSDCKYYSLWEHVR